MERIRFGRIRFLLFLVPFLLGLAGRPLQEQGELDIELRLKLYNRAIARFEKAKALHAIGRKTEALEEIQRATKIVAAFPEAYDLARRIYLERGDPAQAAEEENTFRYYEGDKGASLYRLRTKVMETVGRRRKATPPPEIDPVPTYVASGFAALLLLLGMIYDHRRFRRELRETDRVRKLVLEPFPDDDFLTRPGPSGFFRFCALLLPGPFLFSLLVLWGVRHYLTLLPLFLFGLTVIDITLYVVFFMESSDSGGFRRPGGAA